MDSFHCNVLGGMCQGDGGDLWGGGAVSDALEERGGVYVRPQAELGRRVQRVCL